MVVCDRRGAPRQGNKGDQVDADALSELLRRGGLRTVHHGSPHRATLKELTGAYRTLVEDATRVMLRLKALFRARAIATHGTKVYQVRGRAQWLAQLPDRGARFRAQILCAELDQLRTLPQGQGGDARRGPAGSGLGRAADHSLPRAGAGRPAPGHPGDRRRNDTAGGRNRRPCLLEGMYCPDDFPPVGVNLSISDERRRLRAMNDPRPLSNRVMNRVS